MLAALAAAVLLTSSCGGVGPAAGGSSSGTPKVETAGPAPSAASEDLLADAKKEGSVSWYSSKTRPTATALAKAFEQKYGIEVDLFQAGGSQVLAKVEAELSAGKLRADVVDYSEAGAAVNQTNRGLFARYAPEHLDDVEKHLRSEHGYWTAFGWYTAVIIYNPKQVSAADAPKSWADLTKPQWRGKIAMGSPDYAGSAITTLQGWNQKLGDDYLKRLGPNLQVMKSFGDVQNAVVSGEAPVGITLSFRAFADQAAGKPVRVVSPTEGEIALGSAMAINAKATHSAAAKLFLNFVLSDEAQRVMTSSYQYPARPGAPLPKGMPDIAEVRIVYPQLDELAHAKHVSALKRSFAEVTS